MYKSMKRKGKDLVLSPDKRSGTDRSTCENATFKHYTWFGSSVYLPRRSYIPRDNCHQLLQECRRRV